MSPVGFEPTVSAGEWPQTHALDRAATGIDDTTYEVQEFNFETVELEKFKSKQQYSKRW